MRKCSVCGKEVTGRHGDAVMYLNKDSSERWNCISCEIDTNPAYGWITAKIGAANPLTAFQPYYSMRPEDRAADSQRTEYW